MNVVALLPRNLLVHLRHVLGNAHSLSAAADTVELHALLRVDFADLLIVDPALQNGLFADALEDIIARHRVLPVILYTTLQPTAVRLTLRFARLGVQQVVLNRFDDEPRRFLDLIERAPAHPMAELMLQELAGQLRALPLTVTRVIEQLFRSASRIRTSQELAKLAGMAPRSLYRHLTPAKLQPRGLIICARLLRAYPLLRTPGRTLKEIAAQLGYSDPDTLSNLLHEWTGHAPKDIRRAVAPEVFVQLLATHLQRVTNDDEVASPA